jgi:DNA gyrase/topoisomerase IV subunit A
MHEQGTRPTKYVSRRVVGDVMGKYHPRRSGVYDALVRMARISPCACR